jgi:hypothetical protein
MDTNRKFWNQQQQRLQLLLARAEDHSAAIALALRQHAMLHTAAVARSGLWSFEDEVWDGLTERIFRRVPKHEEHSIAWVIWHITRIEDVTMNMLVAGRPQVICDDHWLERMKSPIGHTGNAMTTKAVAAFSAAIDIEALRDYRLMVGFRTQEIIQGLQPEALRRKVDRSRVQRIRDDEVVLAAASEIVDYWEKRTLAGLLLMPATRHNFVHWNEALRLKNRRG